MTRDEIMQIARDAGIDFQHQLGTLGAWNTSTCGNQSIERMERFAALVVAAVYGDDSTLLNEIEAGGLEGSGLDRTPQGWRAIPKGKLTPVTYKDLRAALKSALGIGVEP